ncbi:hypothetical protein R3P38DRAFT_3601488 [Favolaschia claudopus]|uniref:Uncharacterized protein n=1 Tax=Favolaschia claudopus TaxID=2862362 RepID=A0AAW0AC59_9AGAR
MTTQMRRAEMERHIETFSSQEKFGLAFEALLKLRESDNGFVFVTEYRDIPDLRLRVPPLGALDLSPLKDNVAQALKTVAIPLSNEAWKIPADEVNLTSVEHSQIELVSPAWHNWVQDEAGPAALRGLGVNPKGCECLFTHLEIVEGNTEYNETNGLNLGQLELNPSLKALVASVDDTRAKFASLTIILPSLFSGGHLKFGHDGQSIRIELDGKLTSVIAVYDGVEQTTFGLTSGVQLRLVYAIASHEGSPSSQAEPRTSRKTLRSLFRAWQRASNLAPEFIVYLLRDKYPHASVVDADSLQGADKTLVSTLRPVAEESHIRVYFVHLDIKTMTSRETDTSWSEGDSTGDASFSTVSSDPDEDNEVVNIVQCFDLNGQNVEIPNIDIDLGSLLNGPNVVGLQDPDEVKESQYPCFLETRIYRRTVLVLGRTSMPALDSKDVPENGDGEERGASAHSEVPEADADDVLEKLLSLIHL